MSAKKPITRNTKNKDGSNKTHRPLPDGKTQKTKGGHKGPSGTTTTGKVRNVPVDMSGWRRTVMESRLKFDDVQKKVYCDSLADCGLKGQAARMAGVSLNTVNRHREDDPDFAEAADIANDEYAQKIINHHQNLLLEGEIHTTYDKDGNVISEKRVYPIQLIAMELKRVDPSYREKQQLEVIPGQGGGVLVAPAAETPEEWIKNAEERNRLKREQEAEELTAVNEKPTVIDVEATTDE